MKQLDKMRKAMEEKFHNINWSGGHVCGSGSHFENTAKTRELLERHVEKYNIKTVSDAGAGDLSWISKFDWDVEYTPYDIRKWHPDVIKFDITKDVLPKTDLIVCRHVLHHIAPELRAEAISRFKESGSTYLFLTSGSKKIGLGEPLEKDFEVLDYHNFRGTGKTAKYGLWQINP